MWRNLQLLLDAAGKPRKSFKRVACPSYEYSGPLNTAQNIKGTEVLKIDDISGTVYLTTLF